MVETCGAILYTMIIAGDSWACGEWQIGSGIFPLCVHKGIEQYAIDEGMKVRNLSRGGDSNQDQVNIVANSNVYNEKVFWFITDPLRGLEPTTENPILIAQESLRKTFLAIDRLSIENNCEMYVIGGMCDLEGFVSTDNYNFEVVIPSVNKLLHEDCDILSMYSDIVAAEQVIKNKQYALDVFDQIAKKKTFWKSHPETFPDGGHPGRSAHHYLFEYLKQYM